MKKLIIQKGTGYVVGAIKDDDIFIDTFIFTDRILKACLADDDALVDEIFENKGKLPRETNDTENK